LGILGTIQAAVNRDSERIPRSLLEQSGNPVSAGLWGVSIESE